MPDTERTADALVDLAPDNTTGEITAQVLRDVIVSSWNKTDDPDLAATDEPNTFTAAQTVAVGGNSTVINGTSVTSAVPSLDLTASLSAVEGLTVTDGNAGSTTTATPFAVSVSAGSNSASLSDNGLNLSGPTAGTATIASGAASSVPLIVRGAASQSGNLTQWQNSSASVLSYVSNSGVFTGNGSGLGNLNASNLSSGTVGTARLGTGTANSSTYLRGDGSWQSVSAGGTPGGSNTQVQFNNSGSFGASSALTLSSVGELTNTSHRPFKQVVQLSGDGGGAWTDPEGKYARIREVVIPQTRYPGGLSWGETVLPAADPGSGVVNFVSWSGFNHRALNGYNPAIHSVYDAVEFAWNPSGDDVIEWYRCCDLADAGTGQQQVRIGPTTNMYAETGHAYQGQMTASTFQVMYQPAFVPGSGITDPRILDQSASFALGGAYLLGTRYYVNGTSPGYVQVQIASGEEFTQTAFRQAFISTGGPRLDVSDGYIGLSGLTLLQGGVIFSGNAYNIARTIYQEGRTADQMHVQYRKADATTASAVWGDGSISLPTISNADARAGRLYLGLDGRARYKRGSGTVDIIGTMPDTPAATAWDFWTNDLDQYFTDAAGTNPANVGDPVGRWSAANGNHWTASGAARPTLRQDDEGGYYLEFTGTQVMTLTATLTPTYLGVSLAFGTNASYAGIMGGGYPDQEILINTGGGRQVIGSGGGITLLQDPQTGVHPLDTRFTYSSAWEASAIRLRRNGAVVATQASGSAPVSVTSLGLGARPDATIHLNGRVYRAAVYTTLPGSLTRTEDWLFG